MTDWYGAAAKQKKAEDQLSKIVRRMMVCTNENYCGLKQFTKPRTSTLRVRTIRWKFMLSDLDMFHLHRTLRDVGAIQTLSTHIGEMSILQARPSRVRTMTHVTWPEARK